MSDAKLKTRIKALFKAHLEPRGFTLESRRCPTRRLTGLHQGIEFQPGTGHLAGKFVMNAYWGFTDSLSDGSMAACTRFAHPEPEKRGAERWFSRSEPDFDRDVALAERIVVEAVVPFLDRHDSLAKIVAACASGTLSEAAAFGQDIEWRNYYQGYAHASLGNVDAAIRHFDAVVTLYSDHPHDHVQRRKAAAQAYLDQLRSP